MTSVGGGGWPGADGELPFWSSFRCGILRIFRHAGAHSRVPVKMLSIVEGAVFLFDTVDTVLPLTNLDEAFPDFVLASFTQLRARHLYLVRLHVHRCSSQCERSSTAFGFSSQKKSDMGLAVAPDPGQFVNPKASHTVRSRF